MNTTYKKVLPRRTVLRGVGGIAIALPFLDEMRVRSVYAQPAAPATKCVTVFFGNGLPVALMERGFSGPLAPLEGLAPKLGIYGRLDHGTDKFFHDGGGWAAFTGTASASGPGGASIDQFMLKQKHPTGAPTRLQKLAMGFYLRTTDTWRHIHSWNADRSPAQVPLRSPKLVFEQLFGGNTPSVTPLAPPDKNAAKQRRYDQSILDAVVDEYKHFTGDAGNLTKASRARLSNHLELVRQLETAVGTAPATGAGCAGPPAITMDPAVWKSGAPPTGEFTSQLDPGEVSRTWNLLSDVFALGLHCDVFRFGHATFMGSGDRPVFHAPWEYTNAKGAKRQLVFDDDPDGAHDYFHKMTGKSTEHPGIELHVEYMLANVAYLLHKLDDKAFVGENGRTFLDSHPIVITTELGGRAPHDVREVFHAVSGANGKLKVGMIDMVRPARPAAGALYNACAKAGGVDARLIAGEGELGLA